MTTQLSDFKGQGESSCCGAGTYGEMLMCEDCGEHCGDVSIEELTDMFGEGGKEEVLDLYNQNNDT